MRQTHSVCPKLQKYLHSKKKTKQNPPKTCHEQSQLKCILKTQDYTLAV